MSAYSGAIDVRRDALLGQYGSAAPQRAVVPDLPRYLQTDAGPIGPPADAAPSARDRAPTPPGLLPPLPGQKLPPPPGVEPPTESETPDGAEPLPADGQQQPEPDEAKDGEKDQGQADGAPQGPEQEAILAPGESSGGEGVPAKGRRKAKKRRESEEEDDIVEGLPEPDRGTVVLARPALGLYAEPPRFEAPLSLGIRPSKPAEKLEPEIRDYVSLYGAAAAASRDLYSRLVGQLGRLARDAATEADRAAAQRQRDLDQGIQILDEGLVRSRVRMRTAFHDDLARLAGAARAARRMINGAATSGMARLEARAKRVDADLKEKQGERKTIAGIPGKKLTELDGAAKAATAGFEKLKKPAVAEVRLPEAADGGKAMKAAQKDAAVRDIAFPCDEAILEVKLVSGELKTSIEKQVAPTDRSLCMAFCPFDNMKAMLRGGGEGEGVGSVRKAQTQSLNQLTSMHRKLRRQITMTRHEGERALILQHRAQRQRLIDAAKDRQKLEHDQHQRQARNGAGMLSAAAGAQDAALSSIHDKIADRAASGEVPLATAATEFSRGLLRNGVPRGRSQAEAIENRVTAAAAALTGLGRAASQRFRDGARAALAPFAADLQHSDDAAAALVVQGSGSMARLPEPIVETVDSTLRSVDQNFTTAMGALEQQLGAIRTGLENSFSGNSGKEEDKGKQEEGKAPDCKDCPPAPAEEKEKKDKTTGGKKATSINDFIKRFTEEGAKPETNANIVSYCDRTWKEVARILEERSRNLSSYLCLSDSAFYKVLDQLRGLTAKEGGALEEIYNAKGKNLRKDLDWYLNAGNPASGITSRVEAIKAARAYLNGDVVSGARHELNVCVEWSNDSGQIDKVMNSLTPAQMDEMFQRFPDELKEVEEDLGSLDAKVFEKFKRHDVAGALALRGQAAIDAGREKRGYSGTDKAGDAIKHMYTQGADSRLAGGPALRTSEGANAREKRVAGQWDKIQGEFADIVGKEYNHPVDGGTGEAKPGDALINYATRGITYEVDVPNDVGEGTHKETRHDVMDAAQKRVITNLVRYREGSPEVIAAQFAMEDSRPGGPNPDKIREITQDKDLNAALIVEGAPGGIEAARKRHAEAVQKQQKAMLLLDSYALADGVCRDRPPEDVRKEVAERFAAKLKNDPERADYVKALILADPSDPLKQDAFLQNTVTQLEYAMEGAGTNVGALRGGLSQLTREQYLAVKEIWRVKHGEDLDLRIGVPGKGNWLERLAHSETSGETAQEMEILAQGIPKTEEERIKIGALEMYQQIRDAGVLGPIVAAEEHAQLEADYKKLLSSIGASSLTVDEDGTLQFVDLNNEMTRLGVFDEHGSLKPDAGVTAEELAITIQFGKQSVANYKAATDRIADMIATALVVAAAIVTTALTGGAAASIWIPVLITAAAGIAGMGIKYAIKGGRYGQEEMLFDLASTVIQAATAGIGAAAGAALRGGGKAVGALAKSWRMSEQALATAAAGGATASKALPALTFGQELFIGALTAGFAGGANAAITPDSWRGDDYAGNILAGIVRGAIGGAIGAGTARSIGKLTGPLGEIPSRGLAAGASGAASRMAELSFDDAVLGRRVSWSEMMDQASTAFLQNLVQGLGEGAADVSMRNRSASRRAEHEWHQQNSPEAMQQREAALRRMAEAELGRRGMPANDNPPPEGTIPEAEVAPAPRRPEDGGADGGITVAARRPEEGFAALGTRAGIADEAGSRAPALRRDMEGAEPVARLRSALGDDEPPSTLRTGKGDFDDEVTRPGVPVPHPEFPRGVDLGPGDLDALPVILPDTIVRGTDPMDGAQARRNYDIMRARTPNREVLLAFNPTTGEYMAVQGLPRSVTPPPEGWITLRHSHPRVVGGDTFSHFASILPSGIGGDFSVLRTEVDRLAVSLPNAVVRRASTIDIEVNGQHVQTVFEITKSGDNYSLSVTLRPPQHGVERLGPFTGDRDGALREYAYKARDLTAGGSDFGLGHNKTSGADLLTEGGADAPKRVIRGATLSETERGDATFVAGRMARAEDFDRQARGAAPRGEFDPVIARAATSLDAQDRVRTMGLVGRPDSLERLTRLLNSADPAFTPEMRSALARATLEATRSELIRTGNLAPGDELLMLFRGVTGARTDDYEKGGMDISRLGPGRDEDAGRGLYGSQDFQSALNYAGNDGKGAVLPLIVRRSELGNVIDVRSGTPLGDRWLAYVRATARGGVVKETHPHLSRVLYPFSDSPIGIYRDGRGDRFETFLKTLADDPTLPPAIREAARDPHITLMDLGGVASWGNDRSMLTDQFAMHHQRILDLFNEAHGFPQPGRPGAAEEGPARLRSALGGPEGGDAPAPKPLLPEPDTLPHFDRALELALRPSLREVEGLVKRTWKDQPLIPAQTLTDYVRESDPARRAQMRADIVAQLASGKTSGKDIQAVRWSLTRLEDDLLGYLNTPIRQSAARLPELGSSVVASYILDPTPAGRAGARQAIADHLAAQNMSPRRIQGILRELVALEDQVGGRTRMIAEHLRNGQIAAATDPAIPVTMRRAVDQSPPLALLAARDPKLFGEIAAKYFKKVTLAEAGGDAEQFFFEAVRAKAKLKSAKSAGTAANAAALLALMEPLRAAGIGDFRGGLGTAIRDVRGTEDLSHSRFANRREQGFEGRVPLLAEDGIVPGMRVDHYEFGRATVMEVNGDTVTLLYDSAGAQRTIPVQLSDLDTFPAMNATGEKVPPIVPLRTAAEQQEAQVTIDRIRQQESLPAFAHETEAGTVSIARASGEEGIGTNSTLSARTVNLSHEERAELLGVFKALGLDHQDTTRDPRFVHHGELASLVELRGQLRKAGKPMPEVVELFVDRETCHSCMANLSVVAAYLGIPELRIYTRGQAPGAPPLVIRSR